MNLPPDLAQWLGFTEDSFLIQDGLLRLGDMVEAPPEALMLCDQDSRTQHILSLATEDTQELCVKLEQLCRSENRGFRNLQKYRLSALKGLWKAKKKLEKWKEENAKCSEEGGIVAVRQRKGGNNESSSNFSSKLSLLLLFPLIKSQASLDPSLCQVTTKLLLESLRECPPLSLKEPEDCLDGLENLLSFWLGEDQYGEVRNPETMSQSSLETAAAALVTLACARNSTKTLIHTIYLLQQLDSLEYLPVHDIISILGALEGGANIPATLNSSKHINCWPYEDQLSNLPSTVEEQVYEFGKRSITTDGSFFYITNSNGCGLSKMGTGLSGTMRGFTYTKNTLLEAGFVAFASDVLLHRPLSLDNDENRNKLGVIVDPNTLQAGNTISLIPELLIDSNSQVSTLSLTSNGMEFYWVRCISNANCPVASQVANLIVLDIFCIESNDIIICSTRKILSKKEECNDKSVSFENIVRPKRSSSTNGSLEFATPTQPAPSSSAGQQPNKDENSTSVGITLKVLRLCPIITCGNFITIISSPTPASSPASHLARTLFSGGSNLSKSSAVCNTFSTKDGYFNSKSDLVDSVNSSFGKGALLSAMCATFDTFNNSIWIASMGYIDQFYNTGHKAASYNFSKLGIIRNEMIMTSREDNMASIQEVTSTMIEHIGLVAVHLMANNQSNSPIEGKKSADMTHFEMLISLLEDSVLKNNEKNTFCLMVQAQYLLKSSKFDKISENEKKLISKLKLTLWKLINNNKNDKMTFEACETLIKALPILYPSYVSRTDLLKSLFNEEIEGVGVLQLRDMLLSHFSSLLNDSNNADLKQMFWRSFELNQMILKHTVQTTKELINRLIEDKEAIKLLTIPPKSTGSLQYISALIKSLLTKCLLENIDDDDELQMIIDLIEELFDCCMYLFEFLKEKIELIKNVDNDKEDSERRILAFEEILKSSVLSQGLLPTATSMTEPPFVSLDICQNFISKLVQMSNISCEISNSILATGRQAEENEASSSSIFSTLKIPEPWRAGKIVESTHPLKDNYKFKETIKIPGARGLYLKFDNRCSTQYDYDKVVLCAG